MSKENDTTTPRTKSSRKRLPARTEEAREQQLINDAMNLAEKKLKDGTASSQIVCHFLNLATEKARLEREKIRADVKLQDAKVSALESQKTSEELYSRVISAMKKYQGITDEEYYDD